MTLRQGPPKWVGTPWPIYVAGTMIVMISLAHIPPAWAALNYFDPPKRLLWALLTLVLAAVWSVRKSRLERAPLLLSVGLLAWMIGRTLFKPRPDVELEVLFTWILPLLLFTIATGLDDKRGARILGGFLVLACLIQACLMVLQRSGLDPLFFDTTSAMDYKPGRMVGTIGYQNQAVDFLVLSSAGIFLIVRSPWLRLGFMAGLLLVSGLTGNRGGIVAFVAALLISMVPSIALRDSEDKRRNWKGAAGAVLGIFAICILLALIPETGKRFREAITDCRHSPAVGSRMLMVRVGCEMFREKPWIGWGAGEYAFQYLDRLGAILPDRKTQEMLRNVVYAREAHNDHLQFATEFGVVGMLLLSALVGVGVVRLLWVRASDGAKVAAMAFILSYMAISALFSFPWQTGIAGPLAGFLVGWLWPARREFGREPTEPGGGMGRLGFLAKLVLLSLSLVLAGWFALDAYLNIAFPNRLSKKGTTAAERLVPRCAYHYRALVGAALALQRTYGEAEKKLLGAQFGYCDILLWNNLGHVQSKLGKWDEALETYDKWARCGVDHPAALLNLSIAYEQTGRLKEAVETVERRNAFIRSNTLDEIKRLAALHLQSGNPRAAQETLSRYHQIWSVAEPKAVAEIENLSGAICLALGDQQDAERWFRSALGKNPESESARRNLAGLLKP